MNKHLIVACASFILMAIGLVHADEREGFSLARDKSYEGVTNNDAKISYDLVNIKQNKNLTPALLTELVQAKEKYPTAVRLVYEYKYNPKRTLVGISYIDVQGRVLYYENK